MGGYARTSLGRFYRLATHENVPSEAFLEVGLAAALENIEVWEHFVEKTRWALKSGWEHVRTPPVISTQDWASQGRTDIRLLWPGQVPIVLELKVHEPPSREQIERYLPEAHVAAVARISAPVRNLRVGTHEWLGVLSWQFFRELDWSGAPVVLHQLHQLIDDMGVAMPRINLYGLSGILASWDAWNMFDTWSLQGAHVVADQCQKDGLHLRSRDRRQPSIKFGHQRYAYYLWASPWQPTLELGAFVGLFAGRGDARPVIAELPDICFSMQSKPGSLFRHALLKSEAFKAATTKWMSRAGDVVREMDPLDSSWEFIRVRSGTGLLLAAQDQQAAFYEWFRLRAQELCDDGVFAELAAVYRSVLLPGVEDASPPEEEQPQPSDP